jgi:hypothetical protein
LTRLEATLGLTEFLESGPNAEITNLAAACHDDHPRLALISVEYPAVELRKAGPVGRSVSLALRLPGLPNGPGLVDRISQRAM